MVRLISISSIYIVCLILSCVNTADAQSPRLSTTNQIIWIAPNITYQIKPKVSFNGEYQWRRSEWLNKWQQSLLRLGVSYQVSPRITARIGYAWVETFPYGEYPLNAMGKDFTEHRTFQVLQFTQNEVNIDFTQRIMLEQRWVGRYSQSNLISEDEFPYMNRVRYMFRAQRPLSIKNSKPSNLYLAAFDEAFIGFGKNVNANIFDQNRLAILLGHKLNTRTRVELGVLNQSLQYGRRISDQNVFQYNTGLLLATHMSLGKK